MLGLVGDVGSEVSTDDHVPSGVVFLVKFLLDESGNILLNVELFESLSGNVDSILLHI